MPAADAPAGTPAKATKRRASMPAVPRLATDGQSLRHMEDTKRTTDMKGILTSMTPLVAAAAMCVMTQTATAQSGATRFMGIPIDGSKNEMIAKLKDKGFSDKALTVNDNADATGSALQRAADAYSYLYNQIAEGIGLGSDDESSAEVDEWLYGEFNGAKVRVGVQTNKGKACRVVVEELKQYDESDIRQRYNNLCGQFEANARYGMVGGRTQTLANGFDIYHELEMNNIPIVATYYQDQNINKPVSISIKCCKISKFRIMLCYDNSANMANGDDL